jgi:hypothetical protein
MNRRSLILGLTTLLAAPAIVRASSLMSIKPVGAPDLNAEMMKLWHKLASYPVDGFSWHSGFETLNIPANSILTDAEYTWVQVDLEIEGL